MIESVQWYVDYLRNIAKTDTPTGVEQKEKLLKHKAELEEIEVDKAHRSLIELEEANQGIMETLTVMKAEFLSLPGKVAPICHNKSVAEIKKTVDTEIRNSLNRASEKLSFLAEDIND